MSWMTEEQKEYIKNLEVWREMGEERIDNIVCEIMKKYGPDGHIDGHEVLTAFIIKLLKS